MKDHVEYYKLSDMTPPKYPLTILYGDKGKRKTTTACSMSKERCLLVSADKSWDVLLKDKHKDLFDRTTVVLYDSISQLLYLDYENYDTTIFDTGSAMVEKYVDLIFQYSTWGGKYREKLTTSHEELKGTSIVSLMDYRVVRDKFRPIMEHVIAAPSNLIITAHVNHPIKLTDTTDMTLRPTIPEATLATMMRPATIVGLIEGTTKAKGLTVNVDEQSAYCVASSKMEGIQGKMSLDTFVETYKNNVFGSK